MTYAAFLNLVIDSGLDSISLDLFHDQVDGCLVGYYACRGKSPNGLRDLLYAARQETFDAQAFPDPGGYSRAYHRELSIADVCDIVSAALEHWNMPPTIVRPTARGRLAAGRILGVRMLSEE